MEKRTKRHYSMDNNSTNEKTKIAEGSHAEIETNGPQTRNGTIRNSVFVKVRKEPSFDSDIVDIVRRGTVVKILDTINSSPVSFYKISVNDIVGYIHAIYVEVE